MNNLLIYGPPASGKSFLGQKLSNLFGGIKFFDLDKEIEERTGDTIEQIISYLGEDGFRNVEKDIFEDLIFTENDSIISLGGGTLLNSESRIIAEAENTVICLNFDEKELERNFLIDKKIRPLCQGNNNLQAYKKILSSRKQHYDSFKYQITGSFIDLDSNIENGLSNLFIGPNSNEIIPIILKIFFKNSKIHIIYDKNVDYLFEKLNNLMLQLGLKVSFSKIKSKESNKDLSTVKKILKELKENNFNRNDIIISLGGGITSDISGFVASQWKRGIKWINIPTTLLSMIDASIGGKTGVNFDNIKNLIGTFHKPSFVFIDPFLLQTLPDKEFKNGYVESYKHYLIDKKLYDSIDNIVIKLKNLQQFSDTFIIENSRFIGNILNVKLKIVKDDPFEKIGIREKLNLGHTIGHAIETVTKNKISHGEAVAIGIYHEQLIAKQKGILKDQIICEKILNDFFDLGISVDYPKTITKEKLSYVMRFDKKNIDSNIKMIVLENIGSIKEIYL